MTSIKSNQAALLTGQNQPLAVGPGPDQSAPSEGEIVVQVAAVAINPSEWKMQDYLYLPLQLPHVLGSDFAGTVVKIGAGVNRVKPGDRVIGYVLPIFTDRQHTNSRLQTLCWSHSWRCSPRKLSKLYNGA